MSPEMKLLTINAVIILIGYLLINSSMPEKTREKLIRNDMVLTLLSVVTAAALFAGDGIRFSLILFETNWFWFAVLTMAAMETPFLIWFCRRHGIDLLGDDE
ncbi:hypothetical protein [Paracoccus aerodenitrificans]|uniref:hypothetical protein n=1 Tax=Paracoccus aerodenitrificans TaxID=3017781 RepID=UPI0022F0351D|nr:hypothetical protein [Paracoccus aerodenitrificans]WBU64526.1 hypothetical protein PAE61_03505 [Paracoccus aerodenitrificans]